MEKTVAIVQNTMPKTTDEFLPLLCEKEVTKALNFHKSFPIYCETPLRSLASLAKQYGLKGVYVKDESYRFGLNAFKVLGGSYAIAGYIAGQLGLDIEKVDYHFLVSEQFKNSFKGATFFTATDGNHGRGVAFAAKMLGQKCVVRMPKGSRQIRLQNIQNEGAEVTIEELNYDDCVRLANSEAVRTENGVMVQDTAWEGYTEIPNHIMQGYGTMALEAAVQLGERPTHIFIQAGVGSLAGAVTGYFANLYKENPPIIVVVEARAADCLYKGALAADGDIRIVGGDMPTIMAGLACGEPNIISWDILKNNASYFASCTDAVTVEGMKLLAKPTGEDIKVVSGESGAVGAGLLALLMTDEYSEMKAMLQLDEHSTVLLFSSEGNTDPEGYERIINN